MTLKTESILQKLQKANDVITDIDFDSLKLTALSRKSPIILIECDKNWRLTVIEKFADLSLFGINPTKFRNGDLYQEEKTEFLTLDEVIERIKIWKQDFDWLLEVREMNETFDNVSFKNIIIFPHQQGFLWCNLYLESYTQAIINDRIIFKNEINGLIEAGKQNTDDIAAAMNDLVEGSLIKNNESLMLKSKNGPIPINKDWFEAEIKEVGEEEFKSEYGETCYKILIKIFEWFAKEKEISHEQMSNIITETINETKNV